MPSEQGLARFSCRWDVYPATACLVGSEIFAATVDRCFRHYSDEKVLQPISHPRGLFAALAAVNKTMATTESPSGAIEVQFVWMNPSEML